MLTFAPSLDVEWIIVVKSCRLSSATFCLTLGAGEKETVEFIPFLLYLSADTNLANSCLSSIQRQSNFWRSDVFLISIQYILLSEKSCFFKSIASSVSFHIFAMPVLRIAFWTCVSGAAFCWALVALDGILLWSAFSRDVIGRVCFLVGFNPLMVTLARKEIRLPTNHWRISYFFTWIILFFNTLQYLCKRYRGWIIQCIAYCKV